MPRDANLKQKRDQHIRHRFRTILKNNPKWRIDAVIKDVADEVFLSPVTVGKILKQPNEPATNNPVNIVKQPKKKK
jgi:hypothetical protein